MNRILYGYINNHTAIHDLMCREVLKYTHLCRHKEDEEDWSFEIQVFRL